MTTLDVVGAAILNDGRCLVARRGPDMALAGLWEFPGGKVEPGEAPQDALRREIQEELGIEIQVGALLGVGEAMAGARRIVLSVYAAEWVSGALVLLEHDEVRWCGVEDIEGLQWAEADVPVLPALKARLR
ncbi:MAG: (deoxy)nucleoside triphosphate pyrophosphohydrolase, partial [Alphaproteobacteria bacterium]|nr:(deoxy)nucleoside triphosphate pyrophosphohydrolase [Alphaproteobacteria bacterium]MCB9746589.1 (deoxy)nucleoside triphosphate pyrophosphohydrolase [Alphaproteobacteria bacterium]